MANNPFVYQPDLTAISIGYHNKRMIADEVLPRTGVGKREFQHTVESLHDGFTVPDTRIGRKSKPNRVDTSATVVTSSTQDYGLEDVVPQDDIDNASGTNYNPLGRATEFISSLIELDREIRVAGMVFNASTYGSNTTTLSGPSQWSDASSDPVGAILATMDTMIMRPNVMVLGQAVWTKLRQHPKVVESVYPTGKDVGVVARQAVADLLEIELLLVGEAWVNNARKGQPAVMARTWGKHCAMFYRDVLAGPQNGVTFGYTAQWGDRVAMTKFSDEYGLKGAQVVKSGESVRELITESTLGYFFQNAVA